MAKTKYDLDINKQSIIKPVVILRQGDYGIDTMQVSLAVANEPMDLTGATIKFMGTTANGSKIIDNEHVKIIDAHGGVFEYVFPSEAASDIGEYKVAYFSIVQANGQSSTMDFRVQVLSGVDITASEANGYVSQYGTLVTKLNSAYDSATKATNQKMASTVSSLATSAATVLDSALARVNNVNSTANSASSAASKAVSMASSVATTVTSQASYINSVASSAASNVSSVAEGVVDKLNNISVGGHNYILNSSGKNASASNIPVLSGGTGDSASRIDLRADSILMTNNPGNTKEFFYGLTKAWTDITQTPLIAGNTYTLSLKARGTAKQVALRVGYQNMNPAESVGYTQLDSTNWTKATFTFTIPAATTTIFMRIQGGINNRYSGFAGNETVEFKEVMLEQSNIASDWVPAPEEVDNKIDNIQVGGRNLLLNSKSLFGVYTNAGASYKIEDYDANTKMWHITAPAGTTGGSTGIYFNQLQNSSTSLVSGDKWVMSLDIKGSGYMSRFGLQGSSLTSPSGNMPTDWTRISSSGVMQNTSANIVIYFDTSTVPLDIYIKLPKLEKGNVATDWSPAPEDVPSNDAQLVHKTGNETISGDKTFTSRINGQLVTEPENLFFNSEFENSGEGWQITAGGASFSVYPGLDDILGHTLVTIKLTSGYAKLGNDRLYPAGGKVHYSLSSLVNAGTAAGVYFIVDEFDGNKTNIKSTPYALTSSASWGLKTASFVTQAQTQFLQVTYQVGGSSGQSAYVAAPMWNTGTVPLPYVRGSEMQDVAQLVHKTGTESVAGDKTFTGNTTLGTTIMLAGNYGLRVTSSGFQKTTDGKTWVAANI